MTAAVAVAEPLTPEWFAARRQGVAASEIAAVLGISPWESPFSLFWRKVHGWEVEETEAMATGTRLEPAIADWFGSEFPTWTLRSPGLLAHPDRPWQMATADRTVWIRCYRCLGAGAVAGALCFDCYGEGVAVGAQPLAVLECKWAAYSWDGWGEPETSDIPVHYRAQVQWQCDVLGVKVWHVAALGPGGFRRYSGGVDEKDLRMMREAAARFVAQLDLGEAPPLDDHAATLATVKRLHPDLDDVDVEVPDDIAAGYRRACRAEALAKTVKARYETRLRAAMGSARRALWRGDTVATRSVYEVAEHTVSGHRVDRLNQPRKRKQSGGTST